MKRRDDGLRNAQAADKFSDAFGDFGGGLVGEGHRQNGFRHHSRAFDQVGDAVSDDARLAAARAREDEHRAFSGFDGLALLRVEWIEKRQCGSGSGVDDSILQGVEDRPFGIDHSMNKQLVIARGSLNNSLKCQSSRSRCLKWALRIWRNCCRTVPSKMLVWNLNWRY